MARRSSIPRQPSRRTTLRRAASSAISRALRSAFKDGFGGGSRRSGGGRSSGFGALEMGIASAFMRVLLAPKTRTTISQSETERSREARQRFQATARDAVQSITDWARR